MSKEILFWGSRNSYFEFSNFYRAKISIDGKEWPTTEHYYQAQKFLDEEIQEHIRNQPTPKKAANEGRRKDLPLREDWDQVKEDVMWKALCTKFTQHKRLSQILKNTGDSILIESSPYDSYWGWGRDKKGKNRLGVLLMILRDILIKDDDI